MVKKFMVGLGSMGFVRKGNQYFGNGDSERYADPRHDVHNMLIRQNKQ
jgi:hypothetical protein